MFHRLAMGQQKLNVGDSFTIRLVAKLQIFDLGKEDEQKDRRCSNGYIEDLFAKSDEA